MRVFLNLAYGPIAFLLLALAYMNFTSASPVGIRSEQCSTGDVQCCNLLTFSNDSVLGPLLNLASSTVTGVVELIGIQCTPINILGLTQTAQCQSQPLCCSNKNVVSI
ncbi:hypothetical protein CC1G_04754 [Coprinopsis cinerea okayama7|uniref:Hydrophobin n=1 Tax=Coprinopsis cinerea (strain Okayama-7 / 130 / ATCC MYA-4618 / FGSC 9003) TaxID=240176 RepID=A8P2F8_COPC7|nr:hypothetical protein CC1G_04754 [Coprinopsis cinerea okayama7\|eukprot:XP_001838310.1 hypothetical protein CC1G_04754 [Coprinopsis cinerea okayama7\